MEVKAICDRGDNEAAPKTDTQTLLWGTKETRHSRFMDRQA